MTLNRREFLLGASALALVPVLSRAALAQQIDTLVQWEPNLRPADIKGINALIDGFHAKNPDLTVQVVPTPWDTHEQKILAALNAGTGLPDVGRLSDSGAAANAGYVKPVEQYVDQAWKDEIFDVAWQDCTFTRDGDSGPHIWAIPQMLATEIWFWLPTTGTEKADSRPGEAAADHRRIRRDRQETDPRYRQGWPHRSMGRRLDGGRRRRPIAAIYLAR